MKICFAGTPDFAVPMLEALLRSRHAVGLVVTQPDKPRGRGRVPWAPPVKQLAESRGVPVIQPESINRPEAVASLRAAAPDAIVVTAYGKRLGRRVLALPRLGCFNAHASLLPKYRGAAPIERAILCGESETGVTLQRMAPELDAGAILAQRALKIGDEETAGELSARLAALAAGMIAPLLDAVESGAAVEQPQDAARATEAPSLRKNDGLVPWRLDARGVCNFIRGMTPWPGAFTFHASGERRARLILLAARPADDPAAAATPGQVLRADDQLIVGTGRGCVTVLRVQPEGRKPMDAAAYLRGHALAPGDFLHGT
ncbi:MAG: methionyl-tRNA formyltransferase [Candidatus Brocadiia bacterium]